MIHVIIGERGTGKTKRIIDMANDSAKTAKGSIVFISARDLYTFDLKHSIRLVNASEFHIDGPKMFYGFLTGIAAQDFDLEYIYIDGFLKIVHHPLDTLKDMFKEVAAFAEHRGINVVFSISAKPEEIPEFLKPYAV